MMQLTAHYNIINASLYAAHVVIPAAVERERERERGTLYTTKWLTNNTGKNPASLKQNHNALRQYTNTAWQCFISLGKCTVVLRQYSNTQRPGINTAGNWFVAVRNWFNTAGKYSVALRPNFNTARNYPVAARKCPGSVRSNSVNMLSYFKFLITHLLTFKT